MSPSRPASSRPASSRPASWVVLALVCSTGAEGAVIPSLGSSGRVAPACASDAHVLSSHGFFGSRVAVEEEAATGAASHDHVLREAFDVRRQLMQQSADLARKTADLTRKTADWMEVGPMWRGKDGGRWQTWTVLDGGSRHDQGSCQKSPDLAVMATSWSAPPTTMVFSGAFVRST